MVKVLVCDDSAFMRMILRKLLSQNGYTVIAEAGNGMEAVQLYRKHRPNIVTMDITMPKMDGIEAVKLICDEFPTAKIIMVTAIGQKGVIKDALHAGAADFIVKPFEPSQVLETVKKVLNKPKLNA